MANDFGLEPYFGIEPHTPDRTARPGQPCPTCRGACKRRTSSFVCMGCHAAPGIIETRLRLQRRDDELLAIRRKAAEKAAKFQPRVRAKRRAGLTAKDRAALLKDHGPEAQAWLSKLDEHDDQITTADPDLV